MSKLKNTSSIAFYIGVITMAAAAVNVGVGGSLPISYMLIHATPLSVLVWMWCEHTILLRKNNQSKNDLREMRSLRRKANADSDFERALIDRLQTERDIFELERNISRAEHKITKRKLAAARGRITKLKNKAG